MQAEAAGLQSMQVYAVLFFDMSKKSLEGELSCATYLVNLLPGSNIFCVGLINYPGP